MRVLDLATGRGEPAIPAAHRVGPNGRVLGVDIAEPMLRMTRQRASREGLSNLELRKMNVELLPGVAKGFFQVTLARWCLMYLNEPVRALLAAREAMTDQGVLVAATWAEPKQVSYYSLPRLALEKFSQIPPIIQDAPDEFYYADPDRLAADLDKAGFKIQHREDIYVDVMEAESNAELITWAYDFGMSRLLANVSESVRKQWEVELVRLTEPLRKDNCIRLGGVTHLVVASVR